MDDHISNGREFDKPLINVLLDVRERLKGKINHPNIIRLAIPYVINDAIQVFFRE